MAPVHHLPAPPAGPPGRHHGDRLRAAVRIRFVKVAEYQARGVVHFHAVIRLDAARRGLPAAASRLHRRAPGRGHRPGRRRRHRHSPARTARPSGSASEPRPTPGIIREGSELTATGQALDGQAVANYIAKYATKTLTAPGVPSQRLRHLVDVRHLRCSAHYKQMITTAWQLGGKRQTGEPRLRHGRTCSATAATS